MGFLEEKPEKRQTLDAGLTLLKALRGACEPEFVTDTSDVEASLSH